MTTERRWACVWGAWVLSFAVAETIALRTDHPHAPLSHHLRKHTHILGKHAIGRVVLLAGAGWLHRHLYRPMIKGAEGGGS